MKAPILSKKTVLEFCEHLTYWRLRTISAEFDAADIHCDMDYDPLCSGERRRLVEQYYHTLDLTKTDDAMKLLRAFENILSKVADESERPGGRTEWAGQELRKLTRLLQRDGFEYKNGRLIPVGSFPRRRRSRPQRSHSTPRTSGRRSSGCSTMSPTIRV